MEEEIKTGDFVFELFEESPRVLKVVGDIKNDVVSAENEDVIVISHKSNFRLATEQEVKELFV